MNVSRIHLFITLHLVCSFFLSAHLSKFGRPIGKRSLSGVVRGHHGHRLTKRGEENLLSQVESGVKIAASNCGTSESSVSKSPNPTVLTGRKREGGPELLTEWRGSRNEGSHDRHVTDWSDETDDEKSDDESLYVENSHGNPVRQDSESQMPPPESQTPHSAHPTLTEEQHEHAKNLNVKQFDQAIEDEANSKPSKLQRWSAIFWNHLLSSLSKRTSVLPLPNKYIKPFYSSHASVYPTASSSLRISRELESKNL